MYSAGSVKAWYPAPGYRRFDNSGTLYAIGCDGNSWLSSVPAGSANAHYMTFYYSGFYPQASNSRALGMQVRCLQE